MRWPWQRKSSKDQLIVSWSAGTFAYVRAPINSDGLFAVQQMGVEHQGADSMEDFVRRLQALGLKGLVAHVMLRPEQYQLLQIDAPPVAPEELRAAARFQIREMVNVHIDDITLDVMQVGDGQQKGPSHLFVVAAKNDVVREVIALGDAMHWTVPVIDIQETAQRNLQSALPQGFLTMPWGVGHEATADATPDAFTPVSEYVPDYAGGGTVGGLASSDHGDDERVQRFVVEVQRSLDLWDRTWSSMPLSGLRVYAGERSAELATWLGREMGQTVTAMDLEHQFPGLQSMPVTDQIYCLPLLGVLLRNETRKL